MTPTANPASEPPVLLVMNQEWTSRAIESVLTPSGFHVRHAFTGREACKVVRETPVAALILAASLPDSSGSEVLRELRELLRSRGTPVILLSAEVTSRSQRLEALRDGAWELLTEPYDTEALLLKLRTFLGRTDEARAS